MASRREGESVISFEEFCNECKIYLVPRHHDPETGEKRYVLCAELTFQSLKPRTMDDLEEFEPEFKRLIYDALCYKFGPTKPVVRND